jgi:biopolymer transport protein ExbD
MGADVGVGEGAKSEPNVVPLCDILLVLLIIFMVVTPMIQAGASVKLPEAANTSDEPEPGQMIEVFVKSDGTIYFNDTMVEDVTKVPGLIQDYIEREQPEDKTKVLLKADQDVEYGKVVDVMEQIKSAEIEFVGLVVDRVAK